MSGWELVAVVLSVAYLLLAIRESLWCWVCAFISTAIFTFLFWDVNLFMDSALNVYYMAMAVYGWWHWRKGSAAGEELPVTSRPARYHLRLIAITLVLSVASGAWLTANTPAAWPYLDSFTTWGSVVTTWLVARKVLENWLYWILIDGVSVGLYIDRGLHLTALLFLAYTVMAVIGYRQWRAHLQRERVGAG